MCKLDNNDSPTSSCVGDKDSDGESSHSEGDGESEGETWNPAIRRALKALSMYMHVITLTIHCVVWRLQ